MAKNRYIGEYPVIGIRPIIDGRRGPMQLRESLEDQVMAMAEAAKKLFEENLYYSNGELQCISKGNLSSNLCYGISSSLTCKC